MANLISQSSLEKSDQFPVPIMRWGVEYGNLRVRSIPLPEHVASPLASPLLVVFPRSDHALIQKARAHERSEYIRGGKVIIGLYDEVILGIREDQPPPYLGSDKIALVLLANRSEESDALPSATRSVTHPSPVPSRGPSATRECRSCDPAAPCCTPSRCIPK